MSHRWAWPRSWSSRSSTILAEINRQGTTILLVEQNAHMAFKLANRGYVLETGSVVLSGPSQELAESPEIQRAYLGG